MNKNFFGIDLQLHAEGDGDINESKPTFNDESEDDLDFDPTKAWAEEGEDGEEDKEAEKPAANEGETEEQEQEEEPKETDPNEEKKFSQKDLDQILRERLARDRRNREREQEEAAQLQREETDFQEWANQTYAGLIKRYETLGCDEETAKALAGEEMKTQIRLYQVEVKSVKSAQREQETNAQLQYMKDRAALAKENPLVAKYADEIDEVSGMGVKCDAETATYYVLGKRSYKDKQLNNNDRIVEQRVLKNIEKRNKVKANTSSVPGAKASKSDDLTPDEKMFATIMDVSDSDYAKNKSKKR